MRTPTEELTPPVLRDWALPEPGGSKHSRGRVLVLGGSPSTPGAVLLAGLAALRVGAGVLSMGVAASVAAACAVAVPEAAVIGLPDLDGGSADGRLNDSIAASTGVLVGPGLDDPDHAARLVRLALEEASPDSRLVLDAFALGVISAETHRDLVAGRSVFTPNSAEAARLLGHDQADLDEVDDAEIATAIAERFDVVVSYQDSIATSDGRRWHIAAGQAGLGTSGSGDVLAGAVTGLLARGAGLAQAACWGTYLHAAAGDRLAERVGPLGFLASEIVAELPRAMTAIER